MYTDGIVKKTEEKKTHRYVLRAVKTERIYDRKSEYIIINVYTRNRIPASLIFGGKNRFFPPFMPAVRIRF